MRNPSGTAPLWIDDGPALERLVAELAGAKVIGLDTEFIRERTYYPRLCLVQLASDLQVACIDVLRVDLAPLLTLLGNRSIVKVMHAARQDLEVMLQRLSQAPVPLFDTQVAAALAGAEPQTAYAQLVERCLDLRLDKSQTRTDWARRPLSPAQLRYAADDVRYLPALFKQLAGALERLGRSAWLDQEMRRLLELMRETPVPEQAWRRIRGAGGLSGSAARTALVRLAAWREQEAIRRDRPRQWIVPDRVLLRLAERRPADRAELRSLPGVPPRLCERHAECWLGLLEDAATAPGGESEADPPRRLDETERACLEILLARTRVRARELGIKPELLAPRRELEALIRGERAVPVLAGWRAAIVGLELLERLEQGR